MSGDFPVASQNQLKKWTRLTHAKFRLADGLFIAEGVKVVEELLQSRWSVEAFLTLAEKKTNWEKAITGAEDSAPVYRLRPPEWKKISQDKESEGLIAVVKNKERPSFSSFLDSFTGHLLILHEAGNPSNLGALARSALWFGFGGLLIGSNSVDWTNPKAIRASMGSIFHLAVFSGVVLEEVFDEIKKTRKLIGGDVRRGEGPHPLTKSAALVLGSESHGLPERLLEQVDERWRIPGAGRGESLSLPQAAAIMMHEMTKKE